LVFWSLDDAKVGNPERPVKSALGLALSQIVLTSRTAEHHDELAPLPGAEYRKVVHPSKYQTGTRNPMN
jgi:hypothetical protein